MKTILVLILAGTLPALANENVEARVRASDVQLRCAGDLSLLPGVTSVNLAGSGTDYRLIIVVRDLPAKLAARERLGGDTVEGVKVMWSVSNPAAAAPVLAPPPPARPAPLPPRYEAPSPTRTYVPLVVETRRTFWAGPATMTPPRGAYYGRSNCHPSRGYLAGGGSGNCRTGGGSWGVDAPAVASCARR